MSSGSAPARVALAGNPSDGYGGAVLALTVDTLLASAHVCENGCPVTADDLVGATVARFAREHAPHAAGTTVACETAIPRSVGMGGSSAIVIATLRALCAQHDVKLAPLALAELALAVETEDLGIAAGPQDRIAQAFGGLTFMDFAAQRYVSLDRTGLPPLLVAWRADAAEHSGAVHDDLRDRFGSAQRGVREGMAALAAAAHAAARAVADGERDALARAVDASFDARASIMPLNPHHVALIETARAAGASANYAGSGGAVVCVCADESVRARAAAAFTAGGCGVEPL